MGLVSRSVCPRRIFPCLVSMALAGWLAPGARAGACPTAPGAPTNAGAQDSCNVIGFTWPESSGARNYEVYRDGVLIGGTSYHGYTDNDEHLRPNTYYEYHVVAVGPADPGECRVAGPSSVFHTKLPPALPIAAPTVVATGCSTIAFKWVPPSIDVNKADVWRSSGPGGTGTATVVGLADNPTHVYEDSGLPSHSTFGYFLVPVDYCDQRGPAGEATTASTTPLPPAPGGAPSLRSRACRSIGLEWTEAAPGTKYHLFRRDGGCEGDAALVGITSNTIAEDQDREPGHTYGYLLAYENECQDIGPAGSCAAYSTLDLPAAPGGVHVTQLATGVRIGWSAASGANSYNVFRGTEPGCTGTLDWISNTRELGIEDGFAVPGVPYYYYVQSAGDCGTTDGTCVAGTRYGPPSVPDGSAPGRAPMLGFKGSADAGTINVTWDAGCGASLVRLVYGDESALPAGPAGRFAPTAGSCWESGASGTMTWYGVPAVAPGHMTWWLVYGVDNGGLEGSWGRDSAGAERSGPGAGGSSGQCGTQGKVANHPCE